MGSSCNSKFCIFWTKFRVLVFYRINLQKKSINFAGVQQNSRVQENGSGHYYNPGRWLINQNSLKISGHQNPQLAGHPFRNHRV
jgi:hypothetical protein